MVDRPTAQAETARLAAEAELARAGGW